MFTKNWLKQELHEFIYIFISTFMVDYGAIFFDLYNGNWSGALWTALSIGVLKTVVKVVFQMTLQGLGITFKK